MWQIVRQPAQEHKGKVIYLGNALHALHAGCFGVIDTFR
jgi:hypothetical protein